MYIQEKSDQETGGNLFWQAKNSQMEHLIKYKKLTH
jgi:hypothetical protein